MTKQYEPGTMVRLNPDHEESRLFGTRTIGEREGWIWIVEEIENKTSKNGCVYTCKSLATGGVRGIFEAEIIDATQDSSAG